MFSLTDVCRIEKITLFVINIFLIFYFQFDPEKAQMYSKQLPPLDFQDTDIDLLENTNWMMGSKLIKKSTLKPDAIG